MKTSALIVMVALSQGLALAEPITPDRVSALPATEQPAWQRYLDQSKSMAKQDQAALDAELKAAGMSAATATPGAADFRLPAKAGDSFYAGDAAKRLADTILSYQTPSGGWSKHADYSRGPRTPGMLWSSQYKPGQPPHYLATFDNHSTTVQIETLANVWQATHRDDCAAAVVKGIDFILAAQNPNGGWPQTFPLEGGYHDDITFNDDAMTNVLILLQAVAAGRPAYGFVDEARRTRAADAVRKGIDCLLKTHVNVDGKLTVWCAQHDALTLAPSNARKLEPASLSGGESVRILQFLMAHPTPSPQVIASIEAGLAFFEKARITGIAKVTRDGKTRYDPDPASTEIYWARFYDLKTAAPIFPGRDGVVYDTFNDMADKNSVGYDYYTTKPKALIDREQTEWRKRLGR